VNRRDRICRRAGRHPSILAPTTMAAVTPSGFAARRSTLEGQGDRVMLESAA